ncbi:MAG: sugar ABC transporter substrate-binding protein [Eubacteriales bacterium]
MKIKAWFLMGSILGGLLLQGCTINDTNKDTGQYGVDSGMEEQVQDENGDTTKVIGLSVDQEFDSRIGVTTAIKESAAEKGYMILEFIAEGDAQTQNIQIEELVELEVDSILVCAVDQDEIEESLVLAEEAGIPIVAFDRDLPNSISIDAYVGPDSLYDGKICGEALVEALEDVLQTEETIYVLELVGALNDQNGIDRSKGWNEVLENIPQIEVIQMPTDWDEDSAAEATQNAFQAVSDIKAVFCSTDSFVPYVNEVLTKLGLTTLVGEENHIFINGVNGSSDGYQAVIAGEIDGFMVMNLEEVGITAVELADKLMKGEEVDKITLVESTYYTHETAEINSGLIWGAE